MRLISRIERQGSFLFRWRSFAPLALLPVGAIALFGPDRVDAILGDRVEEWGFGIGIVLAFLGLAVRWFTVGFVPAGTSGRGTAEPRADHLNATGAYSIVRNPLYIGNGLVILGIALAIGVWWFVLVTALAYWLYIERVIAAEESFLAQRYGSTYSEWAARTPAFLPRFRNWQAPALGFSLKTLLRREYNGLLATAAAFLAIDFIEDVVEEGQPLDVWVGQDAILIGGFVGALAVFVILRTLKKRTNLLRVRGR